MSSVLLVWVVVGWHWQTSHSLHLPSHHSVFFNRIIKDGEIIRPLWLEKQLDACEIQHNDCFPMQMQLCNAAAAALQVWMTLPWRFFFICTLQPNQPIKIKLKRSRVNPVNESARHCPCWCFCLLLGFGFRVWLLRVETSGQLVLVIATRLT